MTAIATIYRTGEIVIAADSRRLNPTTGEQTSVCKIRDLKTLFAVVSGIQSYSATGYNLPDLLPAQMVEGDLLTVVESLQQIILSPLASALNHCRQNNPELFKKHALEGSPLTITVVRVENGIPKLVNLTVSVQLCKDDSIALTPRTTHRPATGFFPAPWCGLDILRLTEEGATWVQKKEGC